MTFFWLILYNAIFIPLAYLVLIIWAQFDTKLRDGITGRKTIWLKLEEFRRHSANHTVFLIHSASLGEFEQAKPVIRGLKAIRPDIEIVASFTSPSGFKNAERIREVALFTYLPFDSFLNSRRFIQRLRPAKIIFVTYELWPNLIHLAQRYRIPTYLISARIREGSTKLKPVIRTFFSELYRSLNYIYAISDEHKKSVLKLIGSVNITVLTLGDTRYDQVIQRSREMIYKKIPKIFNDGFVFIAGSLWPQDARHLLPALYRTLREYRQLKIIIAPHEPVEYVLEEFEDAFLTEGFETVRLSQREVTPGLQRVVLVDRVGILAELYHQAHLAFVGGSFRGSIHNVMEPAVAGLPVLFGPTYTNSQEAKLLLEAGGARCCDNEVCIYEVLCNFLTHPEEYQQAALSSRQVILENMGASARTVKEILEST